jgi:hypothetical protein
MFKVSPASLQTYTDTPNCVLEDRVKSNLLVKRVFFLLNAAFAMAMLKEIIYGVELNGKQ